MSRGATLYFLQIEAANPTAAPICPVVRITRGPPRPKCEQLKLRPAIKRLLMFLEYRLLYGIIYGFAL